MLSPLWWSSPNQNVVCTVFKTGEHFRKIGLKEELKTKANFRFVCCVTLQFLICTTNKKSKRKCPWTHSLDPMMWTNRHTGNALETSSDLTLQQSCQQYFLLRKIFQSWSATLLQTYFYFWIQLFWLFKKKQTRSAGTPGFDSSRCTVERKKGPSLLWQTASRECQSNAWMKGIKLQNALKGWIKISCWKLPLGL